MKSADNGWNGVVGGTGGGGGGFNVVGSRGRPGIFCSVWTLAPVTRPVMHLASAK